MHGVAPGFACRNKAAVSKPAIEVFTDSGHPKAATAPSTKTSKALTLSSCEPYRELIEV
jgi:hypothetical protein